MEYKVKRFSRADYEGLDPMGRIEMRKTRNKLAKKLKESRKANNSLMSGKEMLSHRNTAHDLAQDAATKLKNKAATAIKTKSEAREKILRKVGSKAVAGAALVGGGIGLYKLAKNKDNEYPS